MTSTTLNGTAQFLAHCKFRACTHSVTTFGHPTQIFAVTSACMKNANIYYLFKTPFKIHLPGVETKFSDKKCFHVGRDSVVDISASYRPEGRGIESRRWWWGEIFRTRSDRPWIPPRLLHNGYWVIPGGKAAGVWRWPPTHPQTRSKVKETVEL